jgi:hypothetical protein
VPAHRGSLGTFPARFSGVATVLRPDRAVGSLERACGWAGNDDDDDRRDGNFQTAAV